MQNKKVEVTGHEFHADGILYAVDFAGTDLITCLQSVRLWRVSEQSGDGEELTPALGYSYETDAEILRVVHEALWAPAESLRDDNVVFNGLVMTRRTYDDFVEALTAAQTDPADAKQEAADVLKVEGALHLHPDDLPPCADCGLASGAHAFDCPYWTRIASPCECGSEKTHGPGGPHSHWCPAYRAP